MVQCMNSGCTRVAQGTCQACDIAHYCSDKCMRQDWDSQHRYEHAHETDFEDVSIGEVLTSEELIEGRHHGRRHGHHHGNRGKSSKKWVQKTHMKKGAFTRQAHQHHMTPAQFQREVLAHPDRYSATTVRRANLRKTLVHMHH